MLVNRADGLLHEAARAREAAEKTPNAETRALHLELADKWTQLAKDKPLVEIERPDPTMPPVLMPEMGKL